MAASELIPFLIPNHFAPISGFHLPVQDRCRKGLTVVGAGSLLPVRSLIPTYAKGLRNFLEGHQHRARGAGPELYRSILNLGLH